jgi:hypothetical protein
MELWHYTLLFRYWKTVHYKHVSRQLQCSRYPFWPYVFNYKVKDLSINLVKVVSTSDILPWCCGAMSTRVSIKTMHENIPFDQLDNYSDCSIIYLSKHGSLKPVCLQFYNQNSAYQSVSNKITTITIEAKRNITLHAVKAHTSYTRQTVRYMAKKKFKTCKSVIPFTNPISKFGCWPLRSKLKPVRLYPSQQDKQTILTRQDNKCALCKISLKKMELWSNC